MQAARTTAAEHGSRTIVVTDAQPREAPHADVPSSSTRVAPQGGVLRLRGGPRSAQRVVWREDVIDNEGCGKKSSKICCIYHKPRAFDESSSGSSSESDSGDSRHDHPGPHCRRHSSRRHPRKNSSDSDQPSASSSNAAGTTAHESSSVTATEAQDGPVHEQSDSDSDNAYEARPSKRYKAYRPEGQRDP